MGAGLRSNFYQPPVLTPPPAGPLHHRPAPPPPKKTCPPNLLPNSPHLLVFPFPSARDVTILVLQPTHGVVPRLAEISIGRVVVISAEDSPVDIENPTITISGEVPFPPPPCPLLRGSHKGVTIA